MNVIQIIQLAQEVIALIKEMHDAGLFDEAINFYKNSSNAQDIVGKVQQVLNSLPKKAG